MLECIGKRSPDHGNRNSARIPFRPAAALAAARAAASHRRRARPARPIAEAGIHPPETMPFRVAWRDEAGEPGFLESFVAFHEEQRETWRPGAWALVLGVWADGELAGTQSVEAEDFAATRTVSTGSWLGERFQRRGFGTEMRAAVLELAFAGLGATRALSGAIEGNVASERVSAKLGLRAGRREHRHPARRATPRARVRAHPRALGEPPDDAGRHRGAGAVPAAVRARRDVDRVTGIPPPTRSPRTTSRDRRPAACGGGGTRASRACECGRGRGSPTRHAGARPW